LTDLSVRGWKKDDGKQEYDGVATDIVHINHLQWCDCLNLKIVDKKNGGLHYTRRSIYKKHLCEAIPEMMELLFIPF